MKPNAGSGACRHVVCASLVATLAGAAAALGDVRAVVEVEDVVTRYTAANNGAGPLWCYGSTVLARQGERVFCSVIETGVGVPPLSNTRWQLWQRGADGWTLAQHEKRYRQREPCPLTVFHDGPVFLSSNPSTEPVGNKYGPCRPVVFAFNPHHPDAAPEANPPAWAGDTYFTDHSYRGFAADGKRGELLLLNIHARTSAQFVSFRDRAGQWHAKGKIEFPIRAAYPQVALRDGAAHVLAIGDIVEPVAEWQKLKFEKTKRNWDYVFRRLFYTYTPDVATTPFVEPVEVDTVEKTGGHISNLDLHVDAAGTAHLLYLRRPHHYAFLRDKYFPGQTMTVSLEYMIVEHGKVKSRTTLAEAPSDAAGLAPAFGRFHVGPDDRLYVVATGTMPDATGKATFGNFIARLRRPATEIAWTRIELAHPFGSFMTATPRAGTQPSETLDLFGIADDGPNLRYARVRVTGE